MGGPTTEPNHIEGRSLRHEDRQPPHTPPQPGRREYKGNDILEDPTRSSFPRKRESRGWIPAPAGVPLVAPTPPPGTPLVAPALPSSPRLSPRRPGESRGLGERCPLDSGLRRNDEGGRNDEGSRTGAGGRRGVTRKNRLRDRLVYSSRNEAAIRDLPIDSSYRYILDTNLT